MPLKSILPSPSRAPAGRCHWQPPLGRLALLRWFTGTAILVAGGPIGLADAADWPQFHGPQCNGSAAGAHLPTEWSLATGKHVAWTVELPGSGPSSPIVVQDRVFVTSASGPHRDRMHILAFDTDTGQLAWERQFWATGRTMCHPITSNAGPTPASDGERIFALFSSCDLVCLDLDGNLQWLRGLALDYPKAGNDVGMASSPIAIGDIVAVQIECQGDSFLAGIDRELGTTRWHSVRRPEANWASPRRLYDPDLDRDLLYVQSPDAVAALDPATGSIVWRHEATFDAVASSSPTGNQSILVPSNGLIALQRDRNGTSAQVLWRGNRFQSGAASPVVHGDRVYTISRGGILACGATADGKEWWRLRITGGGAFWSTPVAAANKLYLASDTGIVHVVALDGERGRLIAKNDMGEPIQASPAVSGDAIYYRSNRHLWKISASN